MSDMMKRWTPEYEQRIWQAIHYISGAWYSNRGRLPVRDFIANAMQVEYEETGNLVDAYDAETALLEAALSYFSEQITKASNPVNDFVDVS